MCEAIEKGMKLANTPALLSTAVMAPSSTGLFAIFLPTPVPSVIMAPRTAEVCVVSGQNTGDTTQQTQTHTHTNYGHESAAATTASAPIFSTVHCTLSVVIVVVVVVFHSLQCLVLCRQLTLPEQAAENDQATTDFVLSLSS